MIVLNNEERRLDVCIENLLSYRLPDKYLAGEETGEHLLARFVITRDC